MKKIALLTAILLAIVLLSSCNQTPTVNAAYISPALTPVISTSPSATVSDDVNGSDHPNVSSTVSPSSASVSVPTLTSSVLVSSSPSNDNSAEFSDKSGFTFADIKDVEFWFGSGAGGWCTTLKIKPDGTFNGYYCDDDMGDDGPKYPNGTRYECYFSGEFSFLTKTGAYTYSMKCMSLESQGKEGEKKIIDGVRVITSTPYGFDKAGEFFLYLPGKKTSELSEDFLSWGTRWSVKDDILETYGLYNVGGGEGFTVLDDYTLNNG